jgi:hypothetical protein
MRNLCFAAALAEEHSAQHSFAFLLAYTGAANNAEDSASDFAAFHNMLVPEVAPHVGSVTYETIADVLRASGETELGDWLDGRINEGLAARASITNSTP